MSTIIKAKVWPMSEGGSYAVRAGSVEDAKAALVAWLTLDGDIYGKVWTAGEAAGHVAALRYREGWYRWTPCHPSSCFDGGGHRGHLKYEAGPGRGVWRGVLAEYEHSSVRA